MIADKNPLNNRDDYEKFKWYRTLEISKLNN